MTVQTKEISFYGKFVTRVRGLKKSFLAWRNLWTTRKDDPRTVIEENLNYTQDNNLLNPTFQHLLTSHAKKLNKLQINTPKNQQ